MKSSTNLSPHPKSTLLEIKVPVQKIQNTISKDKNELKEFPLLRMIMATIESTTLK